MGRRYTIDHDYEDDILYKTYISIIRCSHLCLYPDAAASACDHSPWPIIIIII